MYLRLFAHILVGFLIGALYYDIGNDGGKVLSNLGFLFFNMLFLMYTSMTITILSCKLDTNYLNWFLEQFAWILIGCFLSLNLSPTWDAGTAEGELQSLVLTKILLFGDNS